MRVRQIVVLLVSIFTIEAIGFFVVAAVHLGAPVDLPGYVQPRGPAAVVSALCGIALVAAAYSAAKRRRNAWRISIGVQVACVVALLVIDRVLAVTDVTPIYRVGTGVAGLVGILLITSIGKRALGRGDGHDDTSDPALR